MGQLSQLWAGGIWIGVLLTVNVNAAVAEPTRQETQAAAQTLFVHPISGSDRASGEQGAPLQTITKALELAEAGTTITLAPGHYSRDSGERFPLQVPDGVALQGNLAGYGDGVVIQGGGTFDSATAGRQSAAVVASGRAVLQGLTLSNSRGHGVWVETGNAHISHSLLWGSRKDGVAIAGVGRPVVEGNRIYQNRGNGISVSDTAAPLIRTNRIEETGYGVVVRDRAVPRLLENYISGNRSGVVVQGRSRPVLRQNHITGNHQDGVVALAEAQPDLGTQGQAGENQFDSNGGYAINAEASDEIIAAAGNHFTAPNPAERLAGRIDLHGVVGDAVSLGTPPDTPGQNSQSVPSAASPPVQLAVIPAADIPSPANSRPTVAQQPLRPSPQRSMAAETVAMRTVAVAAPRRAIPPRNPNLLPVPASSVPVGYAGSRAATSATGGGRRPRYRVLVDVYSRREQALVEAIAPEAFITRINGRMAMQAGAYYQAENANQMLQQLTRTGLRAEVQQMR